MNLEFQYLSSSTTWAHWHLWQAEQTVNVSITEALVLHNVRA